MKKTVYFTPTLLRPNEPYPMSDLPALITRAENLKNAWIGSNKVKLQKIADEKVIITPWGQYNRNVMVTIALTYYEK